MATSERLQIQKLKNSGKQCLNYAYDEVDVGALKISFSCPRVANSPSGIQITFNMLLPFFR